MTYDNWESFKIGDLCEVVKKTINPMHYPKEIFELYSLPAFDNNKTPEKLLGDAIKSNKVVLEKDVILINKLNVRFKRIWSLSNVAENSVSSTEYLVLKPKPLVDKNFLYYYLIGDLFTNTIDGARTGTSNSHQRVKKEFILGQKLNLPTFGHQEAIANLLKSFDDKIEINNKINSNLEELAQTLYKHWFVDFEFPNEEGKPYKSSGGEMVESELGMIPEGWEVKKLGETIAIKYGKNLPTKNLKEKGYPVYGGNGIIGFNDEYIFETPKVIVSCRGAASGKVNYTTQNAFVTNNSLVLLDNDSISYEYLKEFSLFRQYYDFATGSAQPQITIESIKNCLVVVPNQEIQVNFSKIARLTNDLLVLKNKENSNLTEIRDLLLPKLMSGEIEV